MARVWELAIVRGIVQVHGGRITLRSQPEQGSAFLVRLPLEQPQPSGGVPTAKVQ
jgi:signal transduction histidine kinase